MGGVKDHGFRFCSKACHAQKAGLIELVAAVPVASIDAETARIRSGACSRCGRPGNVEFHRSVFVWSAVIYTRMSERTFIACTSCARRAQAKAAAGTLLAGWWGIPFGLLFTPVALCANAYQMLRSGNRRQASASLREYARERLALDVRSPGRAPVPEPAIASVVPGNDDRWRRPK